MKTKIFFLAMIGRDNGQQSCGGSRASKTKMMSEQKIKKQ